VWGAGHDVGGGTRRTRQTRFQISVFQAFKDLMELRDLTSPGNLWPEVS
jgi:hypothetical protein